MSFLNEQEVINRRKNAAIWYDNSKIALTEAEKNKIEIADFGLGKIDEVGFQIVTYINTPRYCSKEMLVLPGQTCPEHRHPAQQDGTLGKQETFRCRSGVAYLYISGQDTSNPKARPPKGDEKYYTAKHEIILNAGEQYTIIPDTLHWFVGGSNGAIISEFSSNSDDESDIFTDPRIVREPKF